MSDNKQNIFDRILNWYKEDSPIGAMSNKQIFWFAFISFTVVIISIIQNNEQQ